MKQKKNWKKVWSLFICMSMVTSCMPITTLAEAENGQIVYDTEALENAEVKVVSDADVESEGIVTEPETEAEITADKTGEQETDAKEQMEMLREQIKALPTVEELENMSKEEQQAVYDDAQAICDAYEALMDEEKEQLTDEVEKLAALFEYFNQLVEETDNDAVSYLTWDEAQKKLVPAADPIMEYKVVTESDTTWSAVENNGWYVVQGSVTISSRVTVSGNVHLILCDGATLTVNGGIHVSGSDGLSIYAQSENGNEGKLIASNAGSNNAGIGGGSEGAGGTIKIFGGNITATGDNGGAGIGGGSEGAGGTIKIFGGNITATNGYFAAGIGGGYYGAGGIIEISGGKIKATSDSGGAGIGGGNEGAGETIEISGGEVEATASSGGAGIGGGTKGAGGAIKISGGNITATGGNFGAGIGGGNYGDGGTIEISGGNITATSSNRGAGIGGGGDGAGGAIKISGGDITATSSNYGAGIGGGYNAAGGTIKISGGNIIAEGGDDGGAGIGGGYFKEGGDVAISGGNVKAVSGSPDAEQIGHGHGNASNNSGTLTDGKNNNVQLFEITLNGMKDVTNISAVTGAQGYGLTDVSALDTNKLYFYLPADCKITEITAGGQTYVPKTDGGLEFFKKVTITGASPVVGIYDGEKHQGYAGTLENKDGYKGIYTVTYSGRENTSYESEQPPTDAGDYSVTITTDLNDTENFGIETLDFAITQREVSINVKIKEKQYNGKTDAEIESAVIPDVVEQDKDKIGVDFASVKAAFASAGTGTGISVSYTGEFKLSGNEEILKNYKLTGQPEGITGNVINNWNPETGKEYMTTIADADGGNNQKFVITAKEGYELSISNTADGTWGSELTGQAEGKDGKLEFYVRNKETGAISQMVTETYKLDKDAEEKKETGTLLDKDAEEKKETGTLLEKTVEENKQNHTASSAATGDTYHLWVLLLLAISGATVVGAIEYKKKKN